MLALALAVITRSWKSEKYLKCNSAPVTSAKRNGVVLWLLNHKPVPPRNSGILINIGGVMPHVVLLIRPYYASNARFSVNPADLPGLCELWVKATQARAADEFMRRKTPQPTAEVIIAVEKGTGGQEIIPRS